MRELMFAIGFIMLIQWTVAFITLAFNAAVDFDHKFGAELTKRQFFIWLTVPVYPFILIIVKAIKRLP